MRQEEVAARRRRLRDCIARGVVCFVAAACGGARATDLTLQVGSTTDVGGCNVRVHKTMVAADGSKLAVVGADCPRAERGGGGLGATFTVGEGDCVQLGAETHCVANLNRDSVTVRLTYTVAGPVLTKVKR